MRKDSPLFEGDLPKLTWEAGNMKKIFVTSIFLFTLIFTPTLATNAFANGEGPQGHGPQIQNHYDHGNDDRNAPQETSTTSTSTTTTTIPVTSTTIKNSGDVDHKNLPDRNYKDDKNKNDSSNIGSNCVTKNPVMNTTSTTSDEFTTLGGGTVTFDTSCGSGTAQYISVYDYKSVDLFHSIIHTETHIINIPATTKPQLTLPQFPQYNPSPLANAPQPSVSEQAVDDVPAPIK